MEHFKKKKKKTERKMQTRKANQIETKTQPTKQTGSPPPRRAPPPQIKRTLQTKSSDEQTNKLLGMGKMRTVNVRKEERKSECLKENRESQAEIFVLGHSL